MDSIKVFCIPYAGGSKQSYRLYEEQRHPLLKIKTLEFPGRGFRIREPLMNNIYQLADDLYEQVKNEVDEENYGLYGHSIGGVAAFLLIKKIMAHGKRAPKHLIISGTSGPSSSGRLTRKIHLLDKKEFFNTIKSFEGLPEEIFEDQELLDFYEPILRADFKASETYVYESGPPLPIPITVITGTEEDIDPNSILLWQRESAYPVDFIRLAGNHFFIFDHVTSIVDIFSKKLIN